MKTSWADGFKDSFESIWAEAQEGLNARLNEIGVGVGAIERGGIKGWIELHPMTDHPRGTPILPVEGTAWVVSFEVCDLYGRYFSIAHMEVTEAEGWLEKLSAGMTVIQFLTSLCDLVKSEKAMEAKHFKSGIAEVRKAEKEGYYKKKKTKR